VSRSPEFSSGAAWQSQPIGLPGWLCGKGSPEGNPSGGGLGVPPRFKKSPKTGGYRGLIKAITVNFYRM